MTSKQAILYLRVSTKRQATDGVSLEAQETACRRWCDYRCYPMAGLFIERGVSGRHADNRPELQAALEACTQGSALVVYSLSRLARSTVDAGRILSQLHETSADFVSVTENLDTTSSAGKLLFNIMAALAEFESDQISERVRAAMEQCKSTGRAHAHSIYGYDLVEGQLVMNKAEQAVIAKMRKWRGQPVGQHGRTEGMTYREIAARLNEKVYPTKRGGRWRASTVSYILKNELHILGNQP